MSEKEMDGMNEWYWMCTASLFWFWFILGIQGEYDSMKANFFFFSMKAHVWDVMIAVPG